MPTINNYSFSPVSYIIEENSIITDGVGAAYAEITISPAPNYSISASNFSLAETPDATYISSVTFTQSGINVICRINFVTGVTMPSENLTLALCISGEGTVKLINVSGTYNVILGSNTSVVPSGSGIINFSGSGNLGQQITLTTRTFSADSGYFFQTTPTAEIVFGNQSDYSIQNTTTYDSDDNLISIAYTIQYLFPSQNVSGQEIVFRAAAQEIYVPTVEVTSYAIDNSLIPQAGATRNLTLYGVPDAQVAITMVDDQTPQNSWTIDPSAIIGANGSYNIGVVFPDGTNSGQDSIQYSINITGDLQNPFGQVLPIVLNQQITAPTITIDSATAQSITGATQLTIQGAPFSEPTQTSIDGIWTLTVATGDLEFMSWTKSNFLYADSIVNTTVATAVTNSATVDVADATGVQIGDKFSIDVQASDRPKAPFQYEITNVSGNTLTVTPNITAAASSITEIYRTNGNIIDNPTVSATQIDSSTVKLDFSIPVLAFGNDDITFTVQLDEIMDVTTQAISGPFTLSSVATLNNGAGACCNGTSSTYYFNALTLQQTTELWTDAAGTIAAPQGTYTDGNNYRTWNGSAFTSTAILCPSCFTGIFLDYSPISANVLCCGDPAYDIYYVAAGETFWNNTGLYEDQALTTPAPDGYYKPHVFSGGDTP